MTRFLLSVISSFLVCTLYTACNSLQPQGEVVATVFDQHLSLEDLKEQISDDLSPIDSTRVAQSIIENWVKTTMLIAQAERNLPDSLKDFTKQLEAEKNSLLVYTYENEYIKQKLDTVITSEEVSGYYEKNSQSFILSDYILRYSLLKIHSEAKNIEKYKIKNLLTHEDSTSLAELENYASEIGATFSLSKDSADWVFLEEFLNQVPIEVYNNESFLKKQKFTDFESDNFRYFVYIKDYKLKDQVSPVELITKKIKTLILNQRKQEMLKSLRTELYQKAVRENKIKYIQ